MTCHFQPETCLQDTIIPHYKCKKPQETDCVTNMVSISAFRIASVSMMILICLWGTTIASSPPKVFNVKSYGAKADGATDDSKAFLGAWSDSCRWRQGYSRVWIPKGSYMLHSVSFTGPCRGKVSFFIEGTVKASTYPSQFLDMKTWIQFRSVDWLSVEGGGVLDGQGASAWKYNDCTKNPKCKSLPVSLRFDYVTNSTIQNIQSLNSKNSHVVLFASENVNVSDVSLTAPGDSPNTDGIHIGNSTDIRITRTTIGTGDDCVSMAAGSKNIDISQVHCGPGHGISIGSLGKFRYDYPDVKGINVVNSNFSDTQNGVRIKTWSPSPPSLASDIVFQYITMKNVRNPVFIDQKYCPSCSKGPGRSISRVQINNVTYSNIQGTSSSKVAVSFQCSSVAPCQDLKLLNISLTYSGPEGGPATASCSNANGIAKGREYPPACL